MEALFPELVSRDDEGYRQVDFRAFPFYIIEALKEVWAVISGHSERIAELEEENAALLERLEAVEAELQIDKASTVSPSAASTEIADDINTNADGDTEIATITEDVADVSAASTAASSTNSDENELTDDTENVAVEETTQSAEAADGDEATVAESVSGDHEEAATSSDASVALTESEGDTAEATEAPEDATVAEPDEVSSEVTI